MKYNKSIARRRLRILTLSAVANSLNAALLTLVYLWLLPETADDIARLQHTLSWLFFLQLLVLNLICAFYVRAAERAEAAKLESSKQTHRLLQQISAHSHNDEQLQRAKELAERANEAKSRYLSGISHELRTPLQAILGYAQLLSQREEIQPRNRDAVQIIKRSGEHLADLIEGLLDISKIEAGRLEIYRNHVALPQLLEQLVQMFHPMAMDKGITFSCHIHNKLPEIVTTDEKRLRQILINLLSNAIKYTHQGSVEFHIRYRSQIAEFSIMDTGIGISAKDLERILDPFERVRVPNTPHVAGTGLGLTIVRLLTEIMGGDLNISSTLGHGSCFKTSLMMAPVTDVLTLTSPQQQITGYAAARKTVMVVDDDPVHRGLMAELLTSTGFTLFESPDAFDSLEMLNNFTPDIFLLDVSMPGMDGLQLAATIRARGFQQPVIMISANAEERHRSAHTPSHHYAYLVKPINHRQLLDTIGQLLNLQWTYKKTDLQRTKNHAPVPRMDLNSIAGHALAQQLLASAELGYKRGVQNKLTEMKQQGLIEDSAHQYLNDLLHLMQFDQIIRSFQTAIPPVTNLPATGQNMSITES